MMDRPLSRRELAGAAAGCPAMAAVPAPGAAEDDPGARRKPKGLRIPRSSLAFSGRKTSSPGGPWMTSRGRSACGGPSAFSERSRKPRLKRGLVLSIEIHTGSTGERPEDALELLDAVPGLEIDCDLGAFLDALLREARADAFVSIEYFQPEMRGQIPALKRVLEDAGLPADGCPISGEEP